MRVLITGINSFTGRYLCAELEDRGWEVFGTCLHNKDSAKQIFAMDLRDSDGIKKLLIKLRPDAVVHLAAISFVGHDKANDFYQTNLIGTRNLLEAISDTTPLIKSILIVSSANVYGNQEEGLLDEGALCNPTNDYAVSKLAMEFMAKTWSNRLPIFIVRPFNYTGVGQDSKFVIPKIISHFKGRKSHLELGNLEVWREFGDVRSVVRAYRKLIEKSPDFDIFNVCTGKTFCLKEVVDYCEKLTGFHPSVEVNLELVRLNEVRILGGNGKKLTSIIGDYQRFELMDTLSWMLSEQ